MNKITLSIAGLATLLLAGFDIKQAQAAHGYRGVGIHIGGPNLHLDIGRPHARHYQSQSRVAYRPIGAYRGHSRLRGHYDWHDTSHYDYHPGEYVRHGNHFDYNPGHYDWHSQGHYDWHGPGHRGRHH